jgi:hypothetical protein
LRDRIKPPVEASIWNQSGTSDLGLDAISIPEGLTRSVYAELDPVHGQALVGSDCEGLPIISLRNGTTTGDTLRIPYQSTNGKRTLLRATNSIAHVTKQKK